MHILITGASGYIGARLGAHLAKQNHTLTLLGSQRVPHMPSPGNHRALAIGPLESETNLASLMEGVDAVVHLAGRTQAHHPRSADPELDFFSANAVAVQKLCDAMRAKNVPRLVHVSSIAARDPVTPYGRSKREGEQHSLALGQSAAHTTVVLRPPMVYGPSSLGPLRHLIRLIKAGVPLPFLAVNNRRSFCAVENLCSAIESCIAAHQIGLGPYEVCDDDIVSLPEIVTSLGDGLGRKPIQFKFHPAALSKMASAISKSTAQSLFSDLVLSNSALKQCTGWIPEIGTRIGLTAVGRAEAQSASNN